MKNILKLILESIKKTEVKIFLYIFFPLVLIFSLFLFASGYDYDYNSPWNFLPFSPKNFSKANYSAYINQVPIPIVDNGRTCYVSAPDPKFFWRYAIGTNEGGSRAGHNLIGPGQGQTGFWIEIDNNQNFLSKNYSSGWKWNAHWVEEITGNAQGFSWNLVPGTFTKVAPVGNPFEYSYQTIIGPEYTTKLSFNTTYYWRILIGDGDSNTGCTVNPPPSPAYPNATLGINCPAVGSEFVNYAINGTNPLTATFTTLPYCPPTNFRFSNFSSYCTNGTPDFWTTNLEWDEINTDETGFEIWQSDTGVGLPVGGDWVFVNNVGQDIEQQTILLAINQTKYYTVKAVNAVGESVFLTPISTTSPSACNPTINPISAFNCDTIAISWVADGAIATSDIYRTVTNSPYGNVVDELIGNDVVGNSYIDNDIVSGNVTYSYRIVSTATSGEILPSYNVVNKIAPCQNLPKWIEGR